MGVSLGCPSRMYGKIYIAKPSLTRVWSHAVLYNSKNARIAMGSRYMKLIVLMGAFSRFE